MSIILGDKVERIGELKLSDKFGVDIEEEKDGESVVLYLKRYVNEIDVFFIVFGELVGLLILEFLMFVGFEVEKFDLIEEYVMIVFLLMWGVNELFVVVKELWVYKILEDIFILIYFNFF